MEKMGVIARVEEPTEWCAGMVPIVKPSGKIRICVDLTHLNESVIRERHILPAVDETLAKLEGFHKTGRHIRLLASATP